jgi:hypothetical protein
MRFATLTWERSLTVSCPACGAVAQSEDVFCGDCGARLATADHGSPATNFPTDPPLDEPAETAGGGQVASPSAPGVTSFSTTQPEPGVKPLDHDSIGDDRNLVASTARPSVAPPPSDQMDVAAARFPLLELSMVQCMFNPLLGSSGEDVDRLNVLAGRAPS